MRLDSTCGSLHDVATKTVPVLLINDIPTLKTRQSQRLRDK